MVLPVLLWRRNRGGQQLNENEPPTFVYLNCYYEERNREINKETGEMNRKIRVIKSLDFGKQPRLRVAADQGFERRVRKAFETFRTENSAGVLAASAVTTMRRVQFSPAARQG